VGAEYVVLDLHGTTGLLRMYDDCDCATSRCVCVCLAAYIEGQKAMKTGEEDAECRRKHRFAMYGKCAAVLRATGRIKLPVCYLRVVKEIWPAPNAQYVGFKKRAKVY
jgi:hypothetical protein